MCLLLSPDPRPPPPSSLWSSHWPSLFTEKIESSRRRPPAPPRGVHKVALTCSRAALSSDRTGEVSPPPGPRCQPSQASRIGRYPHPPRSLPAVLPASKPLKSCPSGKQSQAITKSGNGKKRVFQPHGPHTAPAFFSPPKSSDLGLPLSSPPASSLASLNSLRALRSPCSWEGYPNP